MARAFLPDGDDLVALLDEQERGLLRGLCEQVRELVRPAADDPDGPDDGPQDPFEAIVAGLGDLASAGADGDAATGDAGQLPGRDFGLDEDRDPALDRLFPAGNREDEQEAAEFRRFTEQSLRQRKHANLAVAVDVLSGEGEEVRVTRAQAPAVTIALTDVRLVMGERLGLRTDEDADRIEQVLDSLDDDDPAQMVLAVYDFVTWLQESLTQQMMRG